MAQALSANRSRHDVNVHIIGSPVLVGDRSSSRNMVLNSKADGHPSSPRVGECPAVSLSLLRLEVITAAFLVPLSSAFSLSPSSSSGSSPKLPNVNVCLDE